MEHKLLDGTILKNGITVYCVSELTYNLVESIINNLTENELKTHIYGSDYGTPSFGSYQTLYKYCKENNIVCKQLEDIIKSLEITNDDPIKNIPKFYLGQDVETNDGKGIIVSLNMKFNGIYIEPDTSEATVWYSSENKKEGFNMISKTYKLTELKEL